MGLTELIPTRILKESADECAPILTQIFDMSYETGSFRCYTKLEVSDVIRNSKNAPWLERSNVQVILKERSTTDPANYRPVLMTSVSCKVMEHIIHSQIMRYLSLHNLLVDYQHGFRSGHSCETLLITTVNELVTNIDNCAQTDMIVLDFSNAFDTVPHRWLLEKLKRYGLDAQVIGCI